VLSVDAVALQLSTKTAFCCASHNWGGANAEMAPSAALVGTRARINSGPKTLGWTVLVELRVAGSSSLSSAEFSIAGKLGANRAWLI
jgi:hypothetical protein